MKNFLIGLSLILGLFVLQIFLQKYLPQPDFSHVPKHQRNLVHFAQGAGF
jgi:hypothetical protein